MAPVTLHVGKPSDSEGLVTEAWAEGFMVGGLIVMTGVAIANMRKKVLLHRLIVLELIFGMFHGTFIFTNPPVYNWYLSTTAIFLNISWSLHNVIAWMKNKPFLSKKASLFYIGTVILVQPYWILEITANFLYFSGKSDLFKTTRPYEVLFRDPWWIFTVCSLFWNIKSRYEFGYLEIIKVSPRFGVLLAAMILSICFIIVDVLSVTPVVSAAGLPDGINPFWKLAFVFKCLTDTIVLDDFKTALDRLKEYKQARMGSFISDDDAPFSRPRGSPRPRQKKPSLSQGPIDLTDIRIHDWSEPQDREELSFAEALRMDEVSAAQQPGSKGS